MATNSNDTAFLRAADVRERYGNVSDMWLHRKLVDGQSQFPKPIYIGRLRYWRLVELEEWERWLVTAHDM